MTSEYAPVYKMFIELSKRLLRRYSVVFLCSGLILAGVCGCGQKGSAVDARKKLEELIETYNKKSREEIQVFEPQPFAGPVDASSPDEHSAFKHKRGKKKKKDYVQFVSGRWHYTFDTIRTDTEPYSVEAEAHLYYFYYKPVTENEYKTYEEETGKLYDPTGDPVDKRVKVKIERILFEYTMDNAEWEEKKREVVFDIYKEGDAE
mgnify:CR=1 FL=1